MAYTMTSLKYLIHGRTLFKNKRFIFDEMTVNATQCMVCHSIVFEIFHSFYVKPINLLSYKTELQIRYFSHALMNCLFSKSI